MERRVPFEVLLNYKSWERTKKKNPTPENISEFKRAEIILIHFEKGNEDPDLISEITKAMPKYYPVENTGRKTTIPLPSSPQ